MIILGLTGSIGMGKSTTANMFRYFGIPVHDADATVHDLMGPKGAALDAVETAFPGVVGDAGVDRKALGNRVFGDQPARRRLEAILHPLVRQRETRFLNRQRLQAKALVVLDIPLLFETGGDARVDSVVVATAPAFLQRARVMARPGMTVETFQSILAAQMPDQEKRARADYLVQTGLGRAYALRQVRALVRLFTETD
ncbi:MAG: dephospho-CoA kinase [Magnetovibrionaceae bacterium]